MGQRNRGRRLAPVVVSLALAGIGACAEGIDFGDDDFEEDGATERKLAETTSPEELAEFVDELGLAADHDCGDTLVRFRPAEDAPKRRVFAGQELPWHKWRPCLYDLRDAAQAQPAGAKVDEILYYQVLYLLDDPRVKFHRHGDGDRKKLAKVVNDDGKVQTGRFDRMVETNDAGQAYSAMDQVDMGMALLSIHEVMLGKGLADDDRTRAYRALGLASFDVVTTDTDQGGLRSRKDCERGADLKCSWFHAKTNPRGEDPREGGTLNKHLFAAKYLYRAGDLLADIDALAPDPINLDIADRYQRIAMQGMNQMVYSASGNDGDKLPNLMDYIVEHKGEATLHSWLYYGRNILERRPYHLDEEDTFYKNCNYHMLVLRLLDDNLELMRDDGLDLGGFTKPRKSLGGTSVVDFLLDVYELKQSDGLYVDSDAKGGGNFWACSETDSRELEQSVIDRLRAL